MKRAIQVAHKPAVTVTREMTVHEAVKVMLSHKVGAAVVVDEGRLLGIFTERDLMSRVVLEQRNPSTTKVADVMTAPVIPIAQDGAAEDALRLMVERHFRHLPVVDAAGKVQGMLSMRHLMREQIDDLQSEVSGLSNYISTDGIGG